jgi:hypothetical protein
VVLVLIAGRPTPLAVPVMLVGGWAAPFRPSLLSACPALPFVAFELRVGGVAKSVTGAAGRLDVDSVGGVAEGSGVAGVADAPDVDDSVPTDSVVSPSLAEPAAAADWSVEVLLAPDDVAALLGRPPLLETTGGLGWPARGSAGAGLAAEPAVGDGVDTLVGPLAEVVPDEAFNEPDEDGAAAVPVDDEADEEDDEPEDDDEPDGSAHATPHPLPIAAPMPNATANAPTRPIYIPGFTIPPPQYSSGIPRSRTRPTLKEAKSSASRDLIRSVCLGGSRRLTPRRIVFRRSSPTIDQSRSCWAESYRLATAIDPGVKR